MRRRRWTIGDIAIIMLSTVAASCGGDPGTAFPSGPAQSPTPVAEPFRLQIEPSALMGNSPARGIVTLTLPAPATGTTVPLTSENPAVVVPALVLIPAGALTGEFSISTRSVIADTDAVIRAGSGTQSLRATLAVWAVLPQFFSFVSEPGDFVGLGQAQRATPSTHGFRASCQDGTVSIRVEGGSSTWSVNMAAAPGHSLSGGVYEGAVWDAIVERTGPGMSISGEGRACPTLSGRFVVHEADLTSEGAVRRFSATFEQRCGAGTLRGDVRVADQPTPSEVGRKPCRR